MRGKGVKMMYLIKWITFAAFDPPINVIYTKYNTNFENHILGRVDGTQRQERPFPVKYFAASDN